MVWSTVSNVPRGGAKWGTHQFLCHPQHWWCHCVHTQEQSRAQCCGLSCKQIDELGAIKPFSFIWSNRHAMVTFSITSDTKERSDTGRKFFRISGFRLGFCSSGFTMVDLRSHGNLALDNEAVTRSAMTGAIDGSNSWSKMVGIGSRKQDTLGAFVLNTMDEVSSDIVIV